MPRRPLAFPNLYLWLVLVSSLDVTLTWVVLHLGDRADNRAAGAGIGDDSRVVEER